MTQEKNPLKVNAGRLSAEKRWGPPRILHLGDLTPAQRLYVLNIVEHLREHGIPPGDAR